MLKPSCSTYRVPLMLQAIVSKHFDSSTLTNSDITRQRAHTKVKGGEPKGRVSVRFEPKKASMKDASRPGSFLLIGALR